MRNAAGMETRRERGLVESAAAALRAGESWLTSRVMELAGAHPHPWPVSVSEIGWPLSVRLLAATLVERLRERFDWRPVSPGAEAAGVTDFIQALSFCRRGEDVDLPLFLELVKMYRRAFLDLVRREDFDEETRLDAALLLGAVFDALEVGVCREWSRSETDERRRAWQAVTRRLACERRRYETVFANMGQPAFILGADGQLADVNRAGLAFLEREGAGGRERRPVLGPDACPDDGGRERAVTGLPGLAWLEPDAAAFRREGAASRRLERIVSGVDESRAFAVSLYAVGGQAEAGGMAVLLEEITEVSRKERELEKALRERDVLLREVHHRVKNNMQIISSLISLQAQQTVSEEAAAAFLKSQLRIRAMAAAHESMYRAEGTDKICLGRYLRDILSMVAQVYKKQPPVIKIVNEIEGAYVDMDAVVPCGLIVGELVANSFKHAFKDRTEGVVRVSLARAGTRFTLIVEDDGDGMASEAGAAGSLGLELVRALVDQLYGRLTISTAGGVRFAIEFASPLEDGPGDVPEREGSAA